jgi:hypothetical protein
MAIRHETTPPYDTPDDDLAPAPPEGARRSPARAAGSVLAALVLVGLVVPLHRPAATPSDRRLELVGGPTTTVEASPDRPAGTTSIPAPGIGAPGDGGAATTAPDPTTTEARASAQALLPVGAADPAAGAGALHGSPPTSSSSPDAAAAPFPRGIGAPGSTTTTRPSRSGSTTPGPAGGSTVTTGGSTTTTRRDTSTTRPPTTTTRPATTTTRPPTTTTTRPPTTTTTRPPTTTTTVAPCPRGVLEPDRSSFVFDGQSNSLSPTPEEAYPAKLMATRWPTRAPLAVNRAVAGSSYDERIGWAPEQTDAWLVTLRQPCGVLIQEGGPADLLADESAYTVIDANRRYTAARRQAGFDVIIGATVPPSIFYTAAQDAQRRLYNELLRIHWRDIGLDHLVDVATMPELQDPTNTYWYSDGAHFTDAGSTAVAGFYARQLP